MKFPWGICIKEKIVYVTQWLDNSIILYTLDGTNVGAFGGKGSGKGQFNSPAGITVNNITGRIYVCDCFNNRMQIFKKSLKFVLMFGNNYINRPRDVKLTNDSVIVLDEGDPCVHIFSSSDLSLLYSIISRGEGKQIAYSLFFVIRNDGNIILTDQINQCVRVFNNSGDYMTEFGKGGNSVGEFIKPTGIAITAQNKIIVVSQNPRHALQIF